MSLSLFDYEGRYYYLIFRRVNETIAGQFDQIALYDCVQLGVGRVLNLQREVFRLELVSN